MYSFQFFYIKKALPFWLCFFSFFSFFHFVWGICLGITFGAFTLFIAEGCAFRARDTAACVMLAFIALGLGANVMLTCTLLPSTCLADKDIFLLVWYTVAQGVSASITRVADTMHQGLIAILTELVCSDIHR
jgi:hypothetical protein